MNSTMLLSVALLAHLAAAPAVAAEPTTDACAAFEWNITREIAVMRGEPQRVSALPTGSEIPSIRVGQRYQVALMAQDKVPFVTKPEREAHSDAPRGAVLGFKTQAAGRYRVSLSSRHWVDLLVGGKIVSSAGHQGRAGCQYLHKVVEFDLPAESAVVLQLSGQDDATVSLGITSPAA